MPRYRPLPAAAVLLALSACAGAYFGHTALAAQDQVSEQYKIFTAGLKAVEDVYLGDVDPRARVVEGQDGHARILNRTCGCRRYREGPVEVNTAADHNGRRGRRRI